MNDSATKNKSKTSNLMLKNFSPTSFEVKPITWSHSDNKEIHELKSLFLFKDDFDLHAHLANIPVDIKIFMELDRQTPTGKETTNYLKKTKDATVQLIASLQKEKHLLTTPTKNKALKLKHLLEIMGSHYAGLLSKSSRGLSAAISEIIKALDILCDEDFLGKLIINLHGLSNGNENLQKTLPPPKRGRKEVKLEGGITHKLLYIYTEGTGLEAKCYWHPIYDQSTGEFYQFLLKAIELVKKYTPIKNIDNETWAKHAQEIIKYHYRKSKP